MQAVFKSFLQDKEENQPAKIRLRMLPISRQMTINLKALEKWLSTKASKQENFQANLCLDVTSPP